MAKKSRRPQRSKRERKNVTFSGNTLKRYMKKKRLDTKGTNFPYCRGCYTCCRWVLGQSKPSKRWRLDLDGWVDGWIRH